MWSEIVHRVLKYKGWPEEPNVDISEDKDKRRFQFSSNKLKYDQYTCMLEYEKIRNLHLMMQEY